LTAPSAAVKGRWWLARWPYLHPQRWRLWLRHRMRL